MRLTSKIKIMSIAVLMIFAIAQVFTTGFLAKFGYGNGEAWKMSIAVAALGLLISSWSLKEAISEGNTQKVILIIVAIIANITMLLFTIFDLAKIGQLHGYTAFLYFVVPTTTVILNAKSMSFE